MPNVGRNSKNYYNSGMSETPTEPDAVAENPVHTLSMRWDWYNEYGLNPDTKYEVTSSGHDGQQLMDNRSVTITKPDGSLVGYPINTAGISRGDKVKFVRDDNYPIRS